MQLESRKLLEDIVQAAALLERFARGKKLEDYKSDPMFRSAVERQFEIVGEALKQLADRDATTAANIPELKRIIGFRNILIHGYAQVNDTLVWSALTTHIHPLRSVVQSLLDIPREK